MTKEGRSKMHRKMKHDKHTGTSDRVLADETIITPSFT